MYLLRNSGRYRAEQYEIVKQHRGQIGLRLYGSVPEGSRGREDSNERAAQPTECQQFDFGEVKLTLAPDELSVPDSQGRRAHYRRAHIELPLRDLKRSGAVSNVVNPYPVVREFCEFLTAVTGSYVIAYDYDGNSDALLLDPRRPSIIQGYFDPKLAAKYSRLFGTFMSIGWKYHQLLLNAFRCYRLALAVCPVSVSISYFLLVASMEACAEKLGKEKPNEDDFRKSFLSAIERWKEEFHVDEAVVQGLYARLLKHDGTILARKKRFVKVVSKYLPDSFWHGESRDQPGDASDHLGLDLDTGSIIPVPTDRIRKGDLEQHLGEVYDTRSAFVHEAIPFSLVALAPGQDLVVCHRADRRSGKLAEKTNPKTGRRAREQQKLPTIDWFARVSGEVLRSILMHVNPDEQKDSEAESRVDPEDWLQANYSVRCIPEDYVLSGQEARDIARRTSRAERREK